MENEKFNIKPNPDLFEKAIVSDLMIDALSAVGLDALTLAGGLASIVKEGDNTEKLRAIKTAMEARGDFKRDPEISKPVNINLGIPTLTPEVLSQVICNLPEDQIKEIMERIRVGRTECVESGKICGS
jgi:hypothetical protein